MCSSLSSVAISRLRLARSGQISYLVPQFLFAETVLQPVLTTTEGHQYSLSVNMSILEKLRGGVNDIVVTHCYVS